ncbi:amidohydrolase family protein [Neobittarella massiliensis]|uniref:amidohydrolase family protein n=1 Tax=Neobittarella massiliensis (ex Bilen et al. 2018) TaxID=2041842 RepID=UPI000CF6DAB8|nr:amidohydrolase family protein [Neobittarella massiliensis]
MKIIDAHMHDYQNSPYFDQIARDAGHENSEEHLWQVYRQLGIVGGVVMGNGGLSLQEHCYPDFLHYCIGLDSSCFADGRLPDCADLVEAHLQRQNCVGIKLYPGYSYYYVFDKVYDPFYRLAQKYQKPVAIHTGDTSMETAILKYAHPLTLDEAAVRWPKVQFVMCHFGNPWLTDAAEVVAKNPNVAADLSGWAVGRFSLGDFADQYSGYLQQLRTWTGYVGDYSQLMFGTDWPLVNLSDYIDLIRYLIPERAQEQVFFENANRIWALGL